MPASPAVPAAAAPLPVGGAAPDFILPAAVDKTLRLSDLRGQGVVLAFYPADFSPVCGDQLAVYNELEEQFAAHRAKLLAISVDGVWCHAAYRQQRNLFFPLLSDFHPHGQVARQYGVYRPDDGICERALFVIDEQGKIRWSFVSPIGENPGADGIFAALEQIARPRGAR